MNTSDETNPELESFRQQWRAEVSARSRFAIPGQQGQSSQAGSSTTSSTKVPRKSDKTHKKSASRIIDQEGDEEEYYTQAPTFEEPQGPKDSASEIDNATSSSKEPRTALDHYESAVEKEGAGKLGDSLRLYRKAFRMDHRVDLAYRKKYFPPAASKPGQSQTDPSNAASTVPNTAHHSLDGPAKTLPDLIASFANLSVEPAPPVIEGMPQPPCPIAQVPDEILVHILQDVAVLDVGDFVRLSLVCRRLAYLVATEDQIWRRVCLGSEVGFGGMHYHWQRGIAWDPLQSEEELGDDILSMEELAQRQEDEKEATTKDLVDSLYASSWLRMFRHRPRVRFNGCYISTVNYIRSGQASFNHITWNSPVHIVTYYRYLRLFRDGTAISLTTTNEPADVVHHLTKDLLRQHEDKAATHLPSAVMIHALKGRWRLASSFDNPDASLKDMEGDLFVETEGVQPRYIYRLELGLKTAGKGARNNKLAWKGFWMYNKLTDDWGEFGLKNDKAFFFSRVKSYNMND